MFHFSGNFELICVFLYISLRCGFHYIQSVPNFTDFDAAIVLELAEGTLHTGSCGI